MIHYATAILHCFLSSLPSLSLCFIKGDTVHSQHSIVYAMHRNSLVQFSLLQFIQTKYTAKNSTQHQFHSGSNHKHTQEVKLKYREGMGFYLRLNSEHTMGHFGHRKRLQAQGLILQRYYCHTKNKIYAVLSTFICVFVVIHISAQ